MLPRKIFGVGDLNIPGPTTDQLVAHIKLLNKGGRPVTTAWMARTFNCDADLIENRLYLAKRMGLVRQVGDGRVAG